MTKIKVLIVDDSALVREVLSIGLSQYSEIDVVATAKDPYIARDLIIEKRPDVVTLDVEMPRMDGLEFLKKLMPQFPIPIIMVSSLTSSSSRITFDALEHGAVDFVLKPSSDIKNGLNFMMEQLREKINIASKVDVSRWKKSKEEIQQSKIPKSFALPVTTDKIIAIGASTGGTEAIKQILDVLPANTPGIVIVQHMPAGFTKQFADRLNTTSQMNVKQADSGDRIMQGHVLIAPGDFHLQIVKFGGMYRVVVRSGDKVCGHRPSVDVMFRSVAKYAGSNAIGIMLTGMGSDGADAMLTMRKAGARTLAQNEASSVVFGMPKEAFQRGGAEKLVSIEKIPNVIKEYLTEMQ